MAELAANQLWTPNQGYDLCSEFPVPAVEELIEQWDEPDMMAAPGVYGIIRQPEVPPTTYASVDLCEVVRQSCKAVRAVAESNPGEITTVHTYSMDLPIDQPDVLTILRLLMNNDFVPPVEGIQEIASHLQQLRQEGTYVFANTSTLPGCELGTIDFLKKHLPDAFDGIVFPRNHFGDSTFTKGSAASAVLEAISPGIDRRFVHVDDAPYHNLAVQQEVSILPNTKVQTFRPEYPTDHKLVDVDSIVVPTPLDAIREAVRFLRQTEGDPEVSDSRNAA